MNTLARFKKALWPGVLCLTTAAALLPACSTAPTITATAPPITTTVTVGNSLSPPTVEWLSDHHYAFPELQRLSGDKLWQMISDALSDGRTQSLGTYVVYDDFQLFDVDSAARFKWPGRIAGSVNLQFDYYWVLDPQDDPKPEEVQSYLQQLAQLEINLPGWNKHMPIIFYDSTSDDMAACMAVRLMLDLNAQNNWGFDPKNIYVLNGGFYHYTLDLGHPWVFGDAEDSPG